MFNKNERSEPACRRQSSELFLQVGNAPCVQAIDDFFYLQHKPELDERRRLQLSRLTTVVWALVLFLLAVLALHKVGRVIEVGLEIASVAYGALLGVFLLGVLSRRANQPGAMLGMVCGFGIALYIWLDTRIPWTWYVLIGSLVTFSVGYLSSLCWSRGQGEGQQT